MAKRKSMIKRIDESVKIDKDNKVINGYTPIKINNLKDCRRLLARLIYQLQAGTAEAKYCKDLAYLLIVYSQTFKQYENELRIEELERIAGI